MQTATRAFQALADSTRRSILDQLQSGPASVSELVQQFDMSQPAVSQHLRVLREAGLVHAESRGRRRFYRLEPDALQPAFDWVAQYQRFWTGKLRGLGEHLSRKRQ
jgi:DNA-binding transcriptional ArsR family regulator